MAYPGPKGSARLEATPRTADDFERLATAFRPAWELDDAPFAGAGTLSASDIRALQSGAPNAEVRAATAQALSGIRVQSTPLVAPEPAASILIERNLAPAAMPPGPPPPPPAEMPMSRPVPAPWAPPSIHESLLHPPLGAAPPPRPTPTVPPARGRAPSLDAESSAAFARPSKKPLWIGAGVMGVVLAIAGAWATSGGQQKPAPALEATSKPVENAKMYAIPPPPPETATAPPAAVPSAPTPLGTTAVAALPAPPAATPPPIVAHAVPATQPAARSAYTPPARQTARKGPSIVRDVPF